MMESLDYNEKYRQRTKKFAVAIIVFYAKHCKQTEELRVIGKQLLRSGTSVAANFRAVTRGRSHAERFSKMCIVVEEIDETQFWFESRVCLATKIILKSWGGLSDRPLDADAKQTQC